MNVGSYGRDERVSAPEPSRKRNKKRKSDGTYVSALPMTTPLKHKFFAMPISGSNERSAGSCYVRTPHQFHSSRACIVRRSFEVGPCFESSSVWCQISGSVGH